MKDIVTMDGSGRLVLPKSVRRKLHVNSEASFRYEVAGNRVELTLVEGAASQLKKKRGLLVLPKSGKTFDATEAIDEVRRGRQ